MLNPGSIAYARGSRKHDEAVRLCRAVTLGVAVGLAASLVGCGEDPTNGIPESQSGGLTPGSSGSSPGGAGASNPGSTGGSSAGMPSGNTEGSLQSDIPLGVGGAGGDSSAPGSDADIQTDAALPPSTEPTGFVPCPTDGTPCRVMPLGDSITDGIDMTIGYASNGGYRLELFRQAVTAGHEITFVGTRPPNGPTGDVNLAYIKEFMRFENFEADNPFQS